MYGVAFAYLHTYGFIWVPGLLSLLAGILCGSFMPRIQLPTGFRVGLMTAVVIVGCLTVWTALVVNYPGNFPDHLVVGVVLAFHVLSILAPIIIICVYIHSRRNRWWDLGPRKQL